MKEKQSVSNISIEKNGKTYLFQHSHYYNWFKSLEANLFTSDTVTHRFTQMKKKDPSRYAVLREQLEKAAILLFQKSISEQDSLILLTVVWAQGFHKEKQSTAAAFQQFLQDYAEQSDDLAAFDQFIQLFNQVLIQHFPAIRKQDLRLIYRLLDFTQASPSEISETLETLNEKTAARTQKLWFLLQHLDS